MLSVRLAGTEQTVHKKRVLRGLGFEGLGLNGLGLRIQGFKG